jgi:hypothetical protein
MLWEKASGPPASTQGVVRVSRSGEATKLRLADLSPGWTLRRDGVDERHVAVLMQLEGKWPAIVVWGSDHVVIDGAHRVAAARNLGWEELDVTRFEGTEEAAYVHAVECNVRHGLPLSIEDRLQAVRRVMADHPEWSDRRIAQVCGVSVMVAGRVRAARPGARPEPEYRVGRDGKWRPVHSSAVRERIARELAADGGRSLRAIAAAVGASPETVRSVRKSLALDGPEPGPFPKTPAPGSATPLRVVTDAAVVSHVDGERFARWFDSRDIEDEWHLYLGAIPQSRLYEIADEARRRAGRWLDFARALEGAVTRPTALKA